ncbi:MAG: bifunctional diaminohydroxyphosphoribosylaminopyrimidine deaminase/5-amino-6-(5-phosphoribosylamino)uracil reductase RibD [Steroidobacteraceae bacterium]
MSGKQAWSDLDRVAMSRALMLAERGLYGTDPNPRVGCVLVRDGVVVGEGFHALAGGPHAETLALQAAGERARGATAYVSLEPCDHHGRTPPCTLALIEAGITRVVYALRDPDPRVCGNGEERLRAAGLDVRSGLMAEASAELNVGFVSRLQKGRPFVRVKLAMSLDGRTALANGESRWITSNVARKDAQRFRARSSAVLTGVGTILADDPALNVRIPESDRQPWRIVLDSRLRTPSDSRVINREGRVLIFGAHEDAARRRSLEAQGAAVEIVPGDDRGLDLRAVLERLAALQMNEIWVEAGAVLAGRFVEEGLVDELIVYTAPSLLGSGARPLMALPEPASLESRLQFEYTDFRLIGPDLRLTARPVRGAD